jgi:Amt family ammonium transporter
LKTILSTMADLTLEEINEHLAVAESALNQFWLIFGAVLVFLMQSGFALLEVGSVSQKNTKNILVKNMFDASVGALVFWSVGYAFALGTGNGFIGFEGFFLKTGFVNDDDGTINGYKYATWLFQFAFAATAATIVSGAVAERVQFGAYLVYAFTLIGWVYPVVVHWGWSGDGWASAWKDNQADKFLNVGVIDFAGSGVVHMVGGTAALVGAIIIGPRKGRFNAETGEAVDMPQQSATFQALGTLILWFGWYGFNSVSTLALGVSGDMGAFVSELASVASKTAVTTTISAAAGCMGTLLIGKLMTGIIDNGNANNGVLAGLVAITAGCSVVEPEGAFIIGLISAPVYYFSSKMLLKFHIDDVVDASPVHLFCGAWGVIAASLFATKTNYALAYYDYGANTPYGLFYGGGASQFFANLIFVLVVFAWTAANCVIIFGALKMTNMLRVPAEEEEKGLDISHHGGIDNPEFNRVVTDEAANKV